MTISDLNRELDHHWSNLLTKEQAKLIPFYFSELTNEQKGGLLTIGMNPSFVTNEIERFLSSEHNNREWTIKDFDWDEQSDTRVELSRAQAAYSSQTYARYYSPLWELRERIGAPWAHLDLYRYRQTHQKTMVKLLKDNPEFQAEQLLLLERAIHLHRPKIILVANATASHLLLKRFHLRFDKNAMAHEWTTPDDRRVPIFLAGMLSNGNTDRYSKERLFCLIEKAWGGPTSTAKV